MKPMLNGVIPKVAVMILNFNGKHLLYDCLHSLKQTSYSNYEVYVIDNGSNDESIAYVSRLFPEVKTISFKKNHGFCEGYNKASRLVDAEYMLFLNNDVIIGNPDWLTQMMKMILRDNVGVVGGKLLMAQQKETIENVGGSMLRWQGGIRLGFGEKDLHQYDNSSIDPFCVSGAAFLIKREVFMTLGGFDSEMFAYSEDFDLCWRLRLLGYSIKYCPDAIIFHKASASWKKSMSSLYLSHRNFVRSSIKNYSTANLIKHLPPLLMMSFLFGLFATLLSRNKNFLLSIAKSICYNLLNINSTFRARQFVQHNRKISDNLLFDDFNVRNFEDITTIIKKSRVFV